MMTADLFNELEYNEKMEVTLKGTFLADRLTEHAYVKLYNVGTFYVEMFFDDASHFITHFRVFKNTKFVLPYLDGLKIAP